MDRLQEMDTEAPHPPRCRSHWLLAVLIDRRQRRTRECVVRDRQSPESEINLGSRLRRRPCHPPEQMKDRPICLVKPVQNNNTVLQFNFKAVKVAGLKLRGFVIGTAAASFEPSKNP